MKRIPKSEFKPKSFEYFRLVEERGETLVVTDRGKESILVQPWPASGAQGSSAGALAGAIVRWDAPEEPAAGAEEWEATR